MQHITIIVIVLGAFGRLGYSSPEPNELGAAIEHLAARYRRADSDGERLAICIQAIDQKVISRGASVRVIDVLFGTHLTKIIPKKGKPDEEGIVFLANLPSSSSDDVAAVMQGWYLVVQFNSSGTIQTYSLSNAHK